MKKSRKAVVTASAALLAAFGTADMDTKAMDRRIRDMLTSPKVDAINTYLARHPDSPYATALQTLLIEFDAGRLQYAPVGWDEVLILPESVIAKLPRHHQSKFVRLRGRVLSGEMTMLGLRDFVRNPTSY